MREAGAKTIIIGSKAEQTYNSKLGYSVTSEKSAETISAADIDALVIPGGYAPDTMRINKDILQLVKATFDHGKVVAAICHAAWVLISAKVTQGKNVTCYHTIKDDVINAGANYHDQSVVCDGNLITSRQPGDLPDFCKAIIRSLKG